MNKTNLPKITVVTPSFNQGVFLEECIRSVLEQNYPNLEYFIFDGGSTDSSIKVIKKYESKIDYWVSQKDNGQSDAINKGFRKASGDIVAWLNSDDFYTPDSLITIANAWLKNPEAPFYYGNGMRTDENGKQKNLFFGDYVVPFNRHSMAFGLNYILQPATFMNAKCIREVGFLDESLNYAMDTDLWLKLSKLGTPQPVQHVLAASREYGETKTSTGAIKRIEEIRALNERHTGSAFTIGTMLYLIDTLTRCVDDNIREGLIGLWGHLSRQMQNDLNVNECGFPMAGKPVPPLPATPPPAKEPIPDTAFLTEISDIDLLKSQITFLKEHVNRRLQAYNTAEHQLKSDNQTLSHSNQELVESVSTLSNQLQQTHHQIAALSTLLGDMAHNIRILHDTRKSPPQYALADLLRRFNEQ